MAKQSTNYDINYNDQRFTEVESDKKEALTENEKLYSGIVNESDKYYQAQIDASKEWADKQSQLQQEKTDFAIEQIEQQKDQAKKDYTKEQSGAYVDWQKQSNQYGVNAEAMASQGMQKTGFSESSQVSMYNTYQNRVATAREAFTRAILNYDNAIKDAQLQNNSVLAEIAYQALQQQLELSLEGFQYKNNLLIEQANKKLEIDQMFHERYQDVLDQINQENALAEQIRQFNESMALERAQFEWQKQQAEAAQAAARASTVRTYTGGDDNNNNQITNNDNKISNQPKSSNPDNLNGLNLESVLNAYGPVTGDYVAEQVATGKATATEKNGQVYITKNPTPTVLLPGVAQNALLNTIPTLKTTSSTTSKAKGTGASKVK